MQTQAAAVSLQLLHIIGGDLRQLPRHLQLPIAQSQNVQTNKVQSSHLQLLHVI